MGYEIVALYTADMAERIGQVENVILWTVRFLTLQ